MWFGYIAIGLLTFFLILYYLENFKYRYYQHKLKPSGINNVIRVEDLSHLPEQIQRYLELVGVVGKPLPKGMHVNISGEMKPNKNSDFAYAKVRQTSIFGPFSRYFYMELKMRGLKVKGMHVFQYGIAIMKIKVLGIFRVVNGKGDRMNQAETVTVFNDLCLLAPHALINANVVYEEIDKTTIKAVFINEDIRVEAILFFDEEGKLINFVSHDRYFSEDGEDQLPAPWATPIYEYKSQNGYYLPYKGHAVWLFKDEEFTYFKLTLDDVRYIS